MSFANLVRNIRSNKHSSVTTKSLRNILVSLCVISPCLFVTSKCFSSPFYLVWLICDHHSFVHCLSEPKPSTYLLFLPPRALQTIKSSNAVGPLTPILMPRCVHSAAKTFPLNLLLCFNAVLAFCAWVCLSPLLVGSLCCRDMGRLLISLLSVNLCSHAFSTCCDLQLY